MSLTDDEIADIRSLCDALVEARAERDALRTALRAIRTAWVKMAVPPAIASMIIAAWAQGWTISPSQMEEDSAAFPHAKVLHESLAAAERLLSEEPKP